MLIAVDHGNKQIKTVHAPPFTSGLIQSDTPGFGTDALAYRGKYYTLTDQRIPYRRDMLPMLLATIENDADRALFAEIYEQYHERMEQAALRILKDTHDAEDAVQNAFLKIIRNFEKFLELPCKKRPFWCVCIVKNEAITLLRKKKKAIMLESMEDTYDASADIEKALSYEDIIRLFAGLPETYRAVLEMKFLLDCSGKDISQKLGISENAVNVRISRGRAMLREIMEKEALHL